MFLFILFLGVLCYLCSKQNCFPFLFLISKLMLRTVIIFLCVDLLDITTQTFQLLDFVCLFLLLFVCLKLSGGNHWQTVMVMSHVVYFHVILMLHF